MAWNEPGEPKGNSPWGNKNNQEPPDLDEIIKNMRDKLTVLLGGKSGGGNGNKRPAGKGGDGEVFNPRLLLIPLVIAFIVWMAFGIYQVDQGKQAVVLQFGAYHKTTDAGLQWHLPVVQNYYIVDVSAIQSLNLGDRASEALMLTRDENIVDIKMTVQFRIHEPEKFLFNVKDPGLVLKQVTESAVREIIGLNVMDYIITGGRTEIAQKVQILAQEILDRYQSGLVITNFVLRDAQPPEQVQHAFDDAVKAREDKEKYANQALTYRNEILPLASGRAAQLIAEAEGYSAKVISEAQGEASRFESILKQYHLAEDVTRERLYLDAMQSVLASTGKVLMDNKAGNSLMYLPIDKMLSDKTVINTIPLSSNGLQPASSSLNKESNIIRANEPSRTRASSRERR